MENQVTVRDVIEGTINMLGNIAVPRFLNEQIGMPIDTAVRNLQECIMAFDRAANVAQQEEKEPDAEVIEIGNTDAE